MGAVNAHWIRPPGPVARGMRIGLLGGSFNPAHEGHLHASTLALKALRLDYVWWLVSPQNPLKPEHGMAALAERAELARKLVRHLPRIRVSTIEAELGTRYTVDTVQSLTRRFPGVRFVWIMGSDNLATFHRWRKWRDLANCIAIAVVLRPGSELAPLMAKAARILRLARSAGDLADATPPAIAILDARRNPTSASAIRSRKFGPQDCAMLE